MIDPDGIDRRVRERPEASLQRSHGRARQTAAAEPPPREARVTHKRGTSVANGRNLPASKAVRGTNGSWPSAGVAPKPPPICMLYEDLVEPGEIPEQVFGQYPRTLIQKLLPLLRCKRSEVLHVCSGSLRKGEGIRVDMRREARPDVLADGRALPFRDGSIAAVMLDPPYTPQYAQDLYGVEYPRPSHLLREAARVVRPCGRIAFVHYLVPMPPPGCHLVRVLGLSTGFGFPIRAVTIFEREQVSMDFGDRP